ncbi:MAG TPA: adenylate/guanylate cyclase domain-containing protein, partial [Nannocystis sp.]
MSSTEEQIRQIHAAIAAQETLRPVLGDAVVEVTLAALRNQLSTLALPIPGSAPIRTDALLAQLQGYLPRELADKMRAFGRIDSERKQVTVLFADISGFTEMSERLDAEEVAAMTDAVLQELARAVYESEGYIDKFIGDSVMAVFGAPIVHEDDPDRALRAALAMREYLKKFNDSWMKRVGAPLTLHIGINTGLVIAGNVGSDLRLSYTVMGDTVNTASRLENAARPGQILVSRNTYRLTQESFAFVALDPIQVKGKREPLVVYELHHARLTPGKSRGLKEFKPVFVEREREVAALAELARGLQAGRGHLLVITGDAGIGKSRLMAHWRASFAPQARCLEGRSFPHTTSLPYGPFRDLFLRYASVGDDDREDVVRLHLRAMIERWFQGDLTARALFASMLALHPTPEEDAVLAELPAERRRRELFALVHAWLLALATEGPVILVLEDMHWADTTSIELVESLLPLVRTHPLIIVGVLRTQRSEAPRVFAPSVTAQYAGHCTLFALTPISERGSIGMVQELLQTASLPGSIERIISRKAEGNPFFIEEVVRMLVERGALVRSPGGD